MIVDFHTHIFPPKIIENRDEYCKNDACFALLYSQNKAKLSTAEDLIRSMDESQIDISIALNINWMDHEICIKTNDYIIESINKYPRRIIGFGSVQPEIGERAIQELERCFKNGIRGIGEIRLDLPGFSKANNKTARQLIQMMIARNLIMLIHASEPVGHQYHGKGKVIPSVIYKFVPRYPNLKLVCAHFGGGLPFYALIPEVKVILKNVLFDTAAGPFLYQAKIISHLIEIIGSENLLFGSDYPLMSQSRSLDYIKQCEIKEADKINILSGNALQLLGI